jgi:hypothetical protein
MDRSPDVIAVKTSPLDCEPPHFAQVRLNWTPVLGTWLAPSQSQSHSLSLFRGERPRGLGKPVLDGARLCLPLSLPAPMRIMVCPAGDLFDPDVSLSDIDRVFAVMSISRLHRFSIVTANAAGAGAYVAGKGPPGWAAPAARIEAALDELRNAATRSTLRHAGPVLKDSAVSPAPGAWPLPNVEIREALAERVGATPANDGVTSDPALREQR